ncbi:MAG: histidine kinase dimerization/phospho-acceptor domain-containing protein, partial [Gammaproteobacteria bacterium]
MYKRKLLYFGLTTGIIVLFVLISSALSAKITRESLQQSNIAHSLLIEHKRLSNISYRLFKQLTDEVIFDQNANQAKVRNKKSQINKSINKIRKLALEQRTALGEEITQGSIEDIDELNKLIDLIINEFKVIVDTKTNTPLNEQEQLRYLLESTIDNQFREIINNEVSRQYRVVASINSRIDTLNTTMLWFTLGIGLLSLLLITYACYWLFNQLYHPLMLIKNATKAIALSDYDKPISEKLDDEFQEIASSVNQLATRLQEHEATDASSRKRLKFEVEQRTSELTKINLELTKIDARRRQFISDVSHEFRTPLTIIRGEAQVTLRMDSASELDYKKTLESILNQAINLSQLVDDLLFLTRAEMHQMSLDIIQTNIIQLVEAELSKWQRLYSNRIISLSNELNIEDATLLIDPLRIQQVLSILMDNASKYSPADQPIDVSINDNEKYITIKLKDYGSGISAAEIDNIFERFVRFSKHTEGLGLGLPIAKA